MSNRNDEATGFVIMMWIVFGVFIIPILCLVTISRDGWENTPLWMKCVTVMLALACGVALIASFT